MGSFSSKHTQESSSVNEDWEFNLLAKVVASLKGIEIHEARKRILNDIRK